MFRYSLKNIKEQLRLFKSIEEDYLYNFSWTLNRPLIGPHMLQLVLTTKCNLRCEMCGVWQANEEELDTYYIKKAIDDTYKLGNLQEVYFTGGEVLLRHDIFTLIKYVRDYYPRISTTVNTNGTLLNKQIADKLIDIGLKNLSLSIDSPDPKVHNALRGEGVLEEANKALNYINAEKKRKGTDIPTLHICSILMDQTLETICEMPDFCIRHNVASLHVQPYVCNSDLRGTRQDKFWISEERLPVLKDVLIRMEERKQRIPLHIACPGEKIYRYFSEPVYVDKCYSGFTRALIVGKKINFVCNGPNNEINQHFGLGDMDSLNEAWLSEKANFFRATIKTCKRNCAQFCSIRPSSDSIIDIHQRLMEQKNLFLIFREAHFLEKYLSEYPDLPLRAILEMTYRYLKDNLKELLDCIEGIRLSELSGIAETRYLFLDLRLLDTYLHGEKYRSLSDNAITDKKMDNTYLVQEIDLYKEKLRVLSISQDIY